MIWNIPDPVNKTYVGLGRADKTFDFSRINQTHPDTDDWTQFSLIMMDINGDGRNAAVWNHPAASNKIYVGLAK